MIGKLGRNDACHCGSGKKYKKCCALPGSETAGPAAAKPIDVGAMSALLKDGRYVDLEAAARAQIEATPQAGMSWKLLAAALHGQGKDDLAVQEAIVRLLPNDPEAQTNLGNALRARGRFDEAAAWHRRAIELDDGYAEAHNNLGSVLRELGRPADAAASFRRAISLKARFPMAHNNLGIVLSECGLAEEAVQAHRRALALAPNFADAHTSLGNALRGLGRLEEAASSYRRATAIDPNHVEALVQLGDTLTALSQFEPAVAAFRRVVNIEPRYAEVHGNLGNALRDLGQPAAAVESFRTALALRPESPGLHNGLGNALFDLGDIESAVRSYRRSIELKSDAAKTHSNLGSALRELALLDEAAASHQRALDLQPDSADIRTNLATVQRLLGEPAQAETSIQRALALDPTSAAAVLVHADLVADLGDFTTAEDQYRRAFALDGHSAAAWAGLAALRKFGDGDAAWLAQAQQLALRPLRPRDAVQLHFAIGKYFDDTKDYSRAFAHYRAANDKIKMYRPPHSRAQLAQTFELLARLYDREWIEMARTHVADVGAARPIFVVGMPRSGTSLAEQILASHPQVFGAGELSFWKLGSLEFGRRSLEDGASAVLSAEFAEKYLSLLATLAPEHRYVVDKMPANFAHLGMIHAALPNARIIHMRRDPLDTCLSIYFQNFHIAHSYANDLDDLAHYYDEYLRLMRHWHVVLSPGAILDVPYESLVDDPEMWTRRMIEFVGLPWHDACLNSHETHRTVRTFSKWQVRQKINRRSVQRWRNYGEFVGPLLRLASEPAVVREAMI